MSRRAIALAVLSTAAVVIIAACQDYNLNPVGSCLIQPGSTVHKLDNLSTADILFVIDDSQSMTPKQNALATNFSVFIAQLAGVQADRKTKGMEAFDFYIAVTSSAIFDHYSGSTRTTYISDFSSCDDGAGVPNGPYPNGTFLSVGASNPKVLKFTKDLDWDNYTTDGTIQGLITDFQENIRVGSCGSNQEQTLEAGKLAIEKVLAGQQPIQAGDFLHANSKLVVVWVSDEDDCSNLLNADPVDRNDCNQQPPLDTQVGIYSLDRYSQFFAGLGRPFGAGFITAAQCSGGSCDASVVCNQSGSEPHGWAHSWRLHALASTFRTNGYKVVEDSVCNDFGTTLRAIAELVLPPSTLQLPSLPAASEITMVRIIDSSGNQRKVCTQATSSGQTATAGWWFTTDNKPTDATPDCAGTGAFAGTNPTRCVFINHASTTSDCEAGAGETYSAEYLGVVPPGGCSTEADCATFLSGNASDYVCYQPPGATLKTCLCK